MKKTSYLHIIKGDSPRGKFWTNNTTTLGRVHKVPQPNSSVCPSTDNHRTVVNDTCGESSNSVLLSRLREEEYHD